MTHDKKRTGKRTVGRGTRHTELENTFQKAKVFKFKLYPNSYPYLT